MDRGTIIALDRINRDFYAGRALEWSSTRQQPWPGWQRLAPPLRALSSGASSTRPLRILDVGCANGRLRSWLSSELGRSHRYLGLDRSLPLLAIARRAALHPSQAAAGPPRPIVGPAGWTDAGWLMADLIASGGAMPCRDAAFDAVIVVGLVHHVPSFALRRALIADLTRLLRRGGMLALTFWQFGGEPRWSRRAVPWTAVAGIDPLQLEPGDALLAWGDQAPGGALRYCHHADTEEAARLTADLPLETVDSFRADGHGGALNLYRILRRF